MKCVASMCGYVWWRNWIEKRGWNLFSSSADMVIPELLIFPGKPMRHERDSEGVIWDCQELLYALQAQLLVVASQRWAIKLRATDEPSYCQFMNCIRICIYDVRWWRTPICAVPFRLVIIYEVALFQLVNSFSGEIFLSFRTARRDLNECSPPLHVLVSGHFW